MRLIKYVDTADIEYVAAQIQFRQDLYEEDFLMSVGVVLMNLGDPLVEVECVGGEWSGRKGDLASRTIFPTGLPLCPLKHPLIEKTKAPRLALIEED